MGGQAHKVGMIDLRWAPGRTALASLADEMIAHPASIKIATTPRTLLHLRAVAVKAAARGGGALRVTVGGAEDRVFWVPCFRVALAAFPRVRLPLLANSLA